MSQASREDIENLIELFKRSDWEEMHLKSDDLEIFLSNDPNARAPAEPVAAPLPAAAGPVPAVAAAVAEPAATQATGAPDAPGGEVVVPEGMVAVRAPNLGTFYSAPKPGAPPYVEVGRKVTPDSEVCLIEVMKLFTPVKAGVSGTVRDICAADAQMVEFEQVLVIIEPDA